MYLFQKVFFIFCSRNKKDTLLPACPKANTAPHQEASHQRPATRTADQLPRRPRLATVPHQEAAPTDPHSPFLPIDFKDPLKNFYSRDRLKSLKGPFKWIFLPLRLVPPPNLDPALLNLRDPRSLLRLSHVLIFFIFTNVPYKYLYRVFYFILY